MTKDPDRRRLTIDLVFYTGCLIFAVVNTAVAEFYGYRVWANFAVAGYGLAVVHTGWLTIAARRGKRLPGALGSRWIGIGAIGLFAMILPLGMLVIRRLTGVDWLITPVSWAAQPEVWVIERSAKLLLENGTPYVDVTALGRAVEVNDYTPYGPVMTVFGLPRALLGGGPVANALTDARWMFALAAVACVLLTLRLLKWPKIPVSAAQLALACPLTALTWAVAGPDLAIVGLLVLSFALATTGRVVLSGLVLALVVSAKLIVAPAIVVLGVLVITRRGPRALGGFAAALVVTTLVLHVPVYLVDPKAFVEHVFRFPLGIGVIKSPAASPLPGHLIASLGPVGTAVSFALLGIAAVAILLWLLRRPPATGSDALLRMAVGLVALIMLTPATRYGYLVYPLVLLGARLAFLAAETRETAVPGKGTAPPAQQSATSS
ncbi:glycosyltransferase family 87 protein [Amycolatopsis sp. EV170708-02-1]|uniref:glycosyltransferase family 87 protein n=1 Tax=Amycolatopsis sp. EV170708-02-1 TaxID=2919322 RepID=UPI001F0B8BFD|nr:glycosyltransferase family 87 protein [Amycolatopsis sp. EV170708-02-1]UMP03777.1 glycosyltransferase 87 family protein [Amycolatopsis sp. EV170708-02-1]